MCATISSKAMERIKNSIRYQTDPRFRGLVQSYESYRGSYHVDGSTANYANQLLAGKVEIPVEQVLEPFAAPQRELAVVRR